MKGLNKTIPEKCAQLNRMKNVEEKVRWEKI